MTRPRHQQMRLDRLFAMIVEAADNAVALAPNNVLCDRLCVASPPAVSHLLRELQGDRLIVVETRGGHRRAQVVETKRWTAWTKPAPRIVTRAGCIDPDGPRDTIGGFRGDLPPERYVDRSPCGFCGVRADIGCRHTRRLAA